MKSIQILATSFLFLVSMFASAQGEFIIRGVVSDAETGETLPFANVFVANTTFGTASNEDGSYELVLPSSGSYDLIISFMGYETFARVVRFITPNTVELDAKMVTRSKQLRGVTVTAKKDAEWQMHLARFEAGFWVEVELQEEVR